MASKQKNTNTPKSLFAESIFRIAYRFPLAQVFDDFLTMTIAAFTQNLATGVSWYEDEYLDTIAKYKDSDLRFVFQEVLGHLVLEMNTRLGSSEGNDVLGEFFEQHISNGRNGQYFTPYHICKMMVLLNYEAESYEFGEPLRILDPSCGSGRMLLAAHHTLGPGHEYYGIDIDRTCVKMAALNLFLHGMWNSEVMCANALSPSDFVISYKISFLPLGIFKIEEKEQSKLWHMHRASFIKETAPSWGEQIVMNPVPFAERKKDEGNQLDLFGTWPPV